MRTIHGLLTISACAAALSAGCRGSDTRPSPAGPPVAATTIAITAAGVNPRDVVVSRGSRVTFTNSDTRTHQMNSDPHPTHGDCAELDAVGFLAPGSSKTSGNLNDPGVCGFHDHENPNNNSLKGTITVQ